MSLIVVILATQDINSREVSQWGGDSGIPSGERKPNISRKTA